MNFFSLAFTEQSVDDVDGLVQILTEQGSTDDNYVGGSPASLRTKLTRGAYLFYLVGRHATTDEVVITAGTELYTSETGNQELHINKRLWVNPDYRANVWPIAPMIAAQLLVLDTDFPELIDLPTVTVSFNEANHSLIEAFKRIAEGRSATLGNRWPTLHRCFHADGWRTVHATPQFCFSANRRELVQHLVAS